MSREQWFRFYERVKAEHPELTDEQSAHQAGEELYDARCEAADNARKLKREEGR